VVVCCDGDGVKTRGVVMTRTGLLHLILQVVVCCDGAELSQRRDFHERRGCNEGCGCDEDGIVRLILKVVV